MKKILFLTLIIVLAFNSLVLADEETVSIYINGNKLETDGIDPLLKDDRTFLPVRMVGEKFGYKVIWNEEDKSIVLEKDKDKLNIKIDEMKYTINSKPQKMDVTPFIKDDVTFVPVRFVMEAFGKNVNWKQDTFSVYIDDKEFNGDSKLNKFLNKNKVYESFMSEPMGSSPPRLYYANKDYSVILNYNGVIIIDNKTGKLKAGIDNRTLDYSQMQGGNFVTVQGNDKGFFFLTKFNSPKSGYIYSIKDNALRFCEDASMYEFKEAKIVNPEVEKEILDKYIGSDPIGYSMIDFDEGFSYLQINYNDLKASKLTIMNQEQKEIIEFKLSSIVE